VRPIAIVASSLMDLNEAGKSTLLFNHDLCNAAITNYLPLLLGDPPSSNPPS
jgi:hypothetical protein